MSMIAFMAYITTRAVGTNNRRKLAFTLQICAFACIGAIGSEILRSKDKTEEHFGVLMAEFRSVGLSKPAHKYSNEEKVVLDYDGKLDSIIQKRNAVIKSLGLTPLGMSWKTDGEAVTISGLYIHPEVFLFLIVVWSINMVIIWTLRPRVAKETRAEHEGGHRLTTQH